MSYITQLCRKKVIKTWTNERKTKRGAKGFVAQATKSYLARCRPSNKCRHGGNEETESMFLAIKVRQSDERQMSPRREFSAWWDKAVWNKWKMTWQKPTGKERSCLPSDKILPGEKAKFCKSIKDFPLILERLLSDIMSF